MADALSVLGGVLGAPVGPGVPGSRPVSGGLGAPGAIASIANTRATIAAQLKDSSARLELYRQHLSQDHTQKMRELNIAREKALAEAAANLADARNTNAKTATIVIDNEAAQAELDARRGAGTYRAEAEAAASTAGVTTAQNNTLILTEEANQDFLAHFFNSNDISDRQHLATGGAQDFSSMTNQLAQAAGVSPAELLASQPAMLNYMGQVLSAMPEVTAALGSRPHADSMGTDIVVQNIGGGQVTIGIMGKNGEMAPLTANGTVASDNPDDPELSFPIEAIFEYVSQYGQLTSGVDSPYKPVSPDVETALRNAVDEGGNPFDVNSIADFIRETGAATLPVSMAARGMARRDPMSVLGQARREQFGLGILPSDRLGSTGDTSTRLAAITQRHADEPTKRAEDAELFAALQGRILTAGQTAVKQAEAASQFDAGAPGRRADRDAAVLNSGGAAFRGLEDTVAKELATGEGRAAAQALAAERRLPPIFNQDNLFTVAEDILGEDPGIVNGRLGVVASRQGLGFINDGGTYGYSPTEQRRVFKAAGLPPEAELTPERIRVLRDRFQTRLANDVRVTVKAITREPDKAAPFLDSIGVPLDPKEWTARDTTTFMRELLNYRGKTDGGFIWNSPERQVGTIPVLERRRRPSNPIGLMGGTTRGLLNSLAETSD